MATIDTHRASYSKPNPNIQCGKGDTLPSPTITEAKRFTYTVRFGDKVRICQNITQVNELLRIHPKARVVKSTTVTTVTTRHERIR